MWLVALAGVTGSAAQPRVLTQSNGRELAKGAQPHALNLAQSPSLPLSGSSSGEAVALAHSAASAVLLRSLLDFFPDRTVPALAV